MCCGEDARLVQHLECSRATWNVELVASTAVEGVARVRADLRLDAERANEPDGAAGDCRLGEVEMDGELAVAEEVKAAGGVKEPGDLGEPVAVFLRLDRGELMAHVFR